MPEKYGKLILKLLFQLFCPVLDPGTFRQPVIDLAQEAFERLFPVQDGICFFIKTKRVQTGDILAFFFRLTILGMEVGYPTLISAMTIFMIAAYSAYALKILQKLYALFKMDSSGGEAAATEPLGTDKETEVAVSTSTDSA